MRVRSIVSIPALLALAAAPAGAGELVEKIVARVNDRLITNSEFQKRFEVFISSPQAGNNPLEARKKLLADLIQEKLLEERAKELSVAATDEEVETAVERVKRQYNLATDAEFEAALKSSNLTRDDLKRQMRNTITLQKVVGRDISSKLDLTDDALRLEYERRKDQLYKVPEQAQVSEIVLRFDANDAAARARAASRIEEARAKVVAGTPFADVAKEYSEGNARERGGTLGSVSKGELVTALDAAVFADPPQELTTPVLLTSSIHLFQIKDRKPAGYKPFAEVKEDLRARIADDLYDKKYAEYIEKLRRDAFIKIYDPSLATTAPATTPATPPAPPAEEKKPS
ncbi:MAG TPA: SurA N-terminal domain-containing protein [Thermoanaerobaculia bacterium]